MEDIRIIGIDYSNGKDFTVVTQKCSKCNYIFSVEDCGITNSIVSPKGFKSCPNCGIEFKKSITCK